MGIICPSCGRNITENEFKNGIYKCRACGNEYLGDDVKDDLMSKLNYANEKRIDNYDFEGALELCREVLEENPESQNANWGALLAEYQIAYLQDVKGDYKPTLLNPNVTTPINKCKYYQKLNTTYRKMADFAEKVRLEVVRESQQIPDYDVFISYKQHVGKSNNIDTEEAKWAAEAYHRLSKLGLRVFYDEVSLNSGTAGWEPHIYAALKSAKYLVVFGSSVDNINAVWVKNEWKRFLSFRKWDVNKTFTIVKKDIKPDELDFDLRSQQMLDVDSSEYNWLKKLVEKVDGHLTKYKVNILLSEAEAFILNRKFKKAKQCYLKVCSADIRNSNGYWGLLMCRFKAMDDYDLVKRRKKIVETSEYNNVFSYAVGEEKERYVKVGSDNLKHNTTGYERKNYNDWRQKTKVARVFKKFFIILFAVLLCVSAVFGGLWYKDLKSKEYSFQLDYGESTGAVTSIKVYVGKEIPELPNNLTIDDKYYMDFVGWFTQPECKGIKVADKDGKSDTILDSKITSLSNRLHQIKLYTGFEIHKYDVTFYDDDGHTILKSVKAEFGTDLEDISNNIFVGDKQVLTWSENLNGSDYSGKITNDLSLYASSFAIKVEYDSNGGNDISTSTVRVGDKVPMPIPERQYYGFEGWAYKDNIVQYGFTAPQENITLVAQWSKTHFSLIRDSNGGLDDSKEMIKAGSTVSLPVLTRQYYRFVGWEYNGSIVDNSFTMPYKDIILTAKWEKTHYAVSLDRTVQYVRIGESITLPNKTQAGYTFNGWDDGNNIYPAGSSYKPTKDITLTAKSDANTYTVSLNANGGSVSSATKEVTYDSIYTLPVPSREGYTFCGWYTENSKNGQRMTNETGSSLTDWNYSEGKTLYAVWTGDYILSFKREDCKDNNGYNSSEKGDGQALNSHNRFEVFDLKLKNCVQNGDTYWIPQGNQLQLSMLMLVDYKSLPKWSGAFPYLTDWREHYVSNDTHNGKVMGTNINNGKIGYGAYYVKITYTDNRVKESNRVNVMQDTKKGDEIKFDLGSINKAIKKIDIIVVYETYVYYWYGVVANTTKRFNWRCEATLNFA